MIGSNKVAGSKLRWQVSNSCIMKVHSVLQGIPVSISISIAEKTATGRSPFVDFSPPELTDAAHPSPDKLGICYDGI